jgi:hypothetical protein
MKSMKKNVSIFVETERIKIWRKTSLLDLAFKEIMWHLDDISDAEIYTIFIEFTHHFWEGNKTFFLE